MSGRLSWVPKLGSQLVAVVLAVGVGAIFVPFSAQADDKPATSDKPIELLSERTASSETFLNPDGSYSTRLFAQPVHYRTDPRRGWEKIDSSLSASKRQGYGWRNEANSFAVDFKDRADDGLVRFEAPGGTAFAISLEDATPASGAKEKDNVLVYKSVFQQVDLQYALLADGLKETLVLRGRQAPASYVFNLKPLGAAKLRVAERGDGALVFGSGSSPEPVFVLEAPVVSDSRADGEENAVAPGKVSLGAQKLVDGSFRVTLRVDDGWLSDPDRVFPVYVDPSLTTTVDLQDGYYDTSAGGNPNMSATTLWVGKNGSRGSTYASAAVFDLASIPTGVTVVDAVASVYLSDCFPSGCTAGTTTGTVELRRLTSGWSATTPWSAVSRDATLLASKALDVGKPGKNIWYQLAGNGTALRYAIQNMVLGASPNYGFLLEKTGGNPEVGFQFASSRSSDATLAPYLDVYWKVQGAQLNPAAGVHANGADLFWQRWTGAESAAYTAAVKADSPAAYWRLDEPAGTTRLVDENGLFPGTYTGAFSLAQPGAYAGSYSASFGGSSGCATTTGASAFGSGDFSLEASFKTSASGIAQQVARLTGAGSEAVELEIRADNTLLGRAANASGGSVRAVWQTQATDGQWHHAVFTRSGSLFTLFVDGVQVDQRSSSLGSVGSSATAAIGCEPGQVQYLQGQVDDVAFYTSALSSTRIQAHASARSTPIPAFDRFEVHRSASAGFTPSASTLIAALKDQAIQSFRDTSAAPSTSFYYKVLTIAGGQTFASNEIRVDLPAAGQGRAVIQPGWMANGATGTHINALDANPDVGSSSLLYVTGNPTRTLLRFELRAVPSGVTVTDAKLELYTFQTNPNATVAAHGLRADWIEGGSNWTLRDSSATVAWQSAGGDFDTPAAATTSSNGNPHWDSWNVTSLVNDWVNAGKTHYGFLLKHQSESGAPSLAWASDNYTRSVALRPRLTVTYQDPTATVVGPVTSIASPAPASKVSGTVTVKAAANDDRKIGSVQFLLDGNALGAVIATPPYQVAWDTTNASRGNHTLSVRATDDAGNQTTSVSVSVAVANSAAPSVAAPTVNGGTPLTGSVSVSTTASDDRTVAKVELYVDGDPYAEDSTAPYDFSWNTLDPLAPTFDGQHTLTARAYDDDGQVTTSTPTTVTVGNTVATRYIAAFGSTPRPLELTYDPDAGTQEQAPVDVTVTNTGEFHLYSPRTVVRYHWVSAGPTPVVATSANYELPTAIGQGENAAVRLSVAPPPLPAGVDRALYKLRVDLFDTTDGVYFTDKGNPPLDSYVTVTRKTPLELGFERYQHYDGEELGLGIDNVVNLATGNNIVHWSPFAEPGPGLSTVVDLTYNSLENGSVSPLGNNVSLSISGLIPFGLPLDVHPNSSDTLAGRTAKWIGFTDADGSYHRFTGATAGDGTVYYAAPAGVHLYLRQYATSDNTKKWALTRPDRITFFFDNDGYPTGVEDGNGNRLGSTLQTVPAVEDAYGLAKRITTITDAAGQGGNPAPNRSFTLSYYSKADSARPALRGKVKSITDHVGHALVFDYYEDGNLLRATERGGTNADGSYLADRSVVLTYTLPDGSGPALATPAARANPDPTTAQSTKLYSVVDPRGNETTFTYVTTGANQSKLASRTNRAGNTTGYTYSGATTTVAMPLQRTWSYTFDSQGRVTSIQDPVSSSPSTVTWTSDNKVQKVTQPTDEFVEYAYNQNGYLTDTWNELRDHTTLEYQNLAVDSNDVSGKWEAGRTIPHLSQLTRKVDPVGNATASNPDDYVYQFGYTPTGNLSTITDPLGKRTAYTYNPDGTVATATLPNNGDGITRATTYNSYDANGLPTKVTDAAGGVVQLGYDARGDLLWTQDPNHGAYTGGDPKTYRSYFSYDSFGRLGRQSEPRSTVLMPGQLIWTDSSYDANDNVISSVSPHFGLDDAGVGPTSAATFDSMDRPTLATGPRPLADGAPLQFRTQYDAAGRVRSASEPRGVMTQAAADDFTTIAIYDKLDRPLTITQYGLDTSATQTRTTNYCYDLAGDLRSVTGPKGSASFTSCPAVAAPYDITGAQYTTKVFYNKAHRQTKVTDALGNYTEAAYDENGQLTSATDENRNTTTVTYDDRGAKSKVVQPFDPTQTPARKLTTLYQYDALGNLSKLISPRAYDASTDKVTFTDYVESYSYDALNRLVKTTLPANASTPQAYVHQAFDANGNLTMVSLPSTQATPSGLSSLEKTTNEYWDAGSIYSTTTPTMPRTRFDYTAEGWQASRVPETAAGSGVLDYGRVMFWGYFLDGLMRELRDIGGQRETYAYDADGNQLTATATGGTPLTITSSWDGFDQLQKVRQPKLGTANYWATSFDYDLHGNVMQLVQNREEDAPGTEIAAGRTETYTFDAEDEPTQQVDDFGTKLDSSDDEQLKWEYSPNGLETKRTLAKNGGSPSSWIDEQVSTHSYFANGLLKTLTTTDGAPAPVTLEQHTLAYEANGIYLNGNRTQDVFKLLGPDTSAPCRTSTCTASWSYDARARVLQEVNGTGTTTDYALDTVGNVTQETQNGTVTRSATYSGQQLTSETVGGVTTKNFYDASGNLDCVAANKYSGTSCPAAGDTQLRVDYVYDYKNRLTAYRGYGAETKSTDYTYDALDRTVSQTETNSNGTTTTNFVYVGASNAVAKETLTGYGATTKTYAYDAAGRRMTLTDGTNRYSYVVDPHGSVSLLLDQSRTVRASYGYTAYGATNLSLTKTASGFNANTNVYRYAGKRFDSGSSTLDMGARRYSATTGRFLQQDLYYDSLDNLDLSSDPISGNRYALAAGNPIGFVEVDGHRVAPGAGLEWAPDDPDDTSEPTRPADPENDGGNDDTDAEDGGGDGCAGRCSGAVPGRDIEGPGGEGGPCCSFTIRISGSPKTPKPPKPPKPKVPKKAGRGEGRPPVNGGWRKVLTPPRPGTSPKRVSYAPRVNQRVRDEASDRRPRSESYHNFDDKKVRDVIKNSDTRGFRSEDGYVQYGQRGVRGGREGEYQVGGYWYEGRNGEMRFYVTHRTFHPYRK